MGLLLHELGRHDEALACHRRAPAIQEKLRGADHVDTTVSQIGIGAALCMRGEIDAALALHRRALSIREEAKSKDDFAIAIAHAALGDSLNAARKLQEALRHFHAALKIGMHDAATHYHCARYWHRAGVVLQALGDMQNAHIHYLKALDHRGKLYGADHPATAAAHHTIGKLMQIMGRQRDALASYQEALAIADKLSHPDAQIHRAAIAALYAAGSVGATDAPSAADATGAIVPADGADAAKPTPATRIAAPGGAHQAGHSRPHAPSLTSLLPRSMSIDADAGDEDGETSDAEDAQSEHRSREKCAVM